MKKPLAASTLLKAGLTLLITSGAIYQVRRAQVKARVASLVSQLSSSQRALGARRWERMVLRPPFLDSNASPLSLSRGSHAELEGLRARTHGRYVQSWPSTDLGLRSLYRLEAPQGAEMLLSKALHATPVECLALAADAVRASQDWAFSRGLSGLTTLSRVYLHASSVAQRCVGSLQGHSRGSEHVHQSATLRAREISSAAFEFEFLATLEPSVTDVIEIEVMTQVSGHSELFRELSRVPRSGTDLADAWSRPETLRACQELRRNTPLQAALSTTTSTYFISLWEGNNPNEKLLSDLARLRARAPREPAVALSYVTAAIDGKAPHLPLQLRVGLNYTQALDAHSTGLSELRRTAAWLRSMASARQTVEDLVWMNLGD